MAMRAEVAVAMTKSAAAFRDLVWPAIREDLGGGDLVPVESVTSTDFAQDLDVLAGVDAWQVVSPDGMRPIASRVQAGWGAINTFTIRWSLRSGNRTEIDKRIDAIRDGYLFPTFTVQGYLGCPVTHTGCHCPTWTDHQLLSAAVIDTVELYEFADSWRHRHADDDDIWKTRDGAYVKDVTGGNKMLVVPWASLPGAVVWTTA